MAKTALLAALASLPHFDYTKKQELRTLTDRKEWVEKNLARMSLLNDSWPHKLEACRFLFSLPMNKEITALTDEEIEVHNRIISEEWKEMWNAVMAGDNTLALDGGIDLIYTVLQLLLHIGFTPATINAAMEEVHASNLTKVDDHGKPVFNDAGKFIKTANYQPPNLERVIELNQSKRTIPDKD